MIFPNPFSQDDFKLDCKMVPSHHEVSQGGLTRCSRGWGRDGQGRGFMTDGRGRYGRGDFMPIHHDRGGDLGQLCCALFAVTLMWCVSGSELWLLHSWLAEGWASCWRFPE